MSFEGISFQIFQGWVFVVLGVGVIGLIDFVSLGYFRRFKLVARLYWPLHKFISWLTLSRFYRPIYYGMVTNFNKWVFFIFLLLFSIGSILIAGNMTDGIYPGDNFSRLDFWEEAQGYSIFNGYYDDQNTAFASRRAHIPSDIITDDVLRFFVVANISYEDEMSKHTPMDSLIAIYPDTSNVALKAMVVDRFFHLYLDGKELKDNRWYFHYKEHTKQRGYLTYLDISNLEQGMHELVLRAPEEIFDRVLATIPFYRDFSNKRNAVPAKQEQVKTEDFQPKPFGIRK